MSCSQASRISKRITQIILLMHFLIKQKCKTILIASALQSKLYWSATTSSSSLIFNSASFPKYSRSIIHSQFIPALCISCIQEVLWVAQAEPRRHSTCSPHWVQGSCCLPHTPLLSGPSAMFGTYTAHSSLVIHGPLKPPNPTQEDMEQERGWSTMSLLRIFQMVTLPTT